MFRDLVLRVIAYARTRARFTIARIRLISAGIKLALTMKPIMGAEGEDDPPPPDPEKKYSEKDIERIVQDRLARDREQRGVDITENGLKELREKAAKADDLQAKVDELEGEKRSETEKAQAAAQKAEEDKAAAEERATKSTEEAHKIVRRAEITSAATKAGAVNADAVYDLLAAREFKFESEQEDGSKNELSVTVGDDGRVTGAEAAVTAFLEANKYLVGSTPDPGPGDGGARTTTTGELTKEQLTQMSPDQVAELDPAKVDAAMASGN